MHCFSIAGTLVIMGILARASDSDHGTGECQAKQIRGIQDVVQRAKAGMRNWVAEGVERARRKAEGRENVGECDQPAKSARIVLDLPVADAGDTDAASAAEKALFRVVIVGGAAAGPKAAAKIVRLKPDAHFC